MFCLQPDPGRIVYSTVFENIRFRTALGDDLQESSLLGNSPSVTTDGARIAYDFGGDVRVANIDGSGAINLTNSVGPVEERPSWSPDGTRVVYHRRELGEDTFDLFVINEDGTGVTNLTPGTPDSSDGEAEWSPDGTKIVFASDRTGAGDLYTMAPDGSGLFPLTTDGSGDTGARWSPDGQQIVFTRFLDPAAGGSDFELFLINSDGTGLTQLTDNPAFRTTDADWSPDGQWMVIASELMILNGTYDLYAMRPDGTDIVQLSFTEGARFPQWLP